MVFEVRQCPYCGRAISPRFRKATFNTTNTTEVYEVYYPQCICSDYKYVGKNRWTQPTTAQPTDN